MKVITEKEELYKLIKEAVREVLNEEIVEIFLKNIPLISKEEMKEKMIRELRKYSKRQMTWMKRNKDIVWYKNKEEAIKSLMLKV